MQGGQGGQGGQVWSLRGSRGLRRRKGTIVAGVVLHGREHSCREFPFVIRRARVLFFGVSGLLAPRNPRSDALAGFCSGEASAP